MRAFNGCVLGALLVAIALAPATVNAQPLGCPVGGHAIISCPVVTDEVIQQAVTTRLAGSVTSDTSRVNVCVLNGIVTLTGHVDTRGKWDLAYLLAGSVRGVRGIANGLTITPMGNRDIALVGQIRRALSKAMFSTREVVVDAVSGSVSLTGAVNTNYDREMVAMIVNSVPGVNAVRNGLVVSAMGADSFTDNW